MQIHVSVRNGFKNTRKSKSSFTSWLGMEIANVSLFNCVEKEKTETRSSKILSPVAIMSAFHSARSLPKPGAIVKVPFTCEVGIPH